MIGSTFTVEQRTKSYITGLLTFALFLCYLYLNIGFGDDLNISRNSPMIVHVENNDIIYILIEVRKEQVGFLQQEK